MDTYEARETLVEARQDRSRLVLVPVVVVAWGAGVVLLVLAAAGLVATVIGSVTGAPLQLVLAATAPLPQNAVDLGPGSGAHVLDQTSPMLTGVSVSVGGAASGVALALRLAPTLAAGADGAAAVLGAIAVQRIGLRVAASRTLLAAAIVLGAGSAVAQAVSLVGAVALGPVAWTALPQIDSLLGLSAARLDATPFAVAAGLLVVVHLLRRLEGAGVLLPAAGRRRMTGGRR